MIIIKKRSPMYRLYAWSIELRGKFACKDLSGCLEETNLCNVFQSILVHIPLIVLAQLATVAAVVFSVIILPVRLFGVGGYMFTLAMIALSIVALVALIWVLVKSTSAVRRLARSEAGSAH